MLCHGTWNFPIVVRCINPRRGLPDLEEFCILKIRLVNFTVSPEDNLTSDKVISHWKRHCKYQLACGEAKIESAIFFSSISKVNALFTK
jgi:hypothetical protein